MKRVHVFVSGRVQGVFFRSNTFKRAKELGLSGWVRNTSDDKVEAVFEGDKNKINKILDFLRSNPGSSKVDHIDIREEKPENLKDFKVLY